MAKKAIALGYDPERDPAPRVLVAVQGASVEKVIEIADNHSIPVVESAAAVEQLQNSPGGSMIPEQSFEVIAALYSAISRFHRRPNENLE